MECELVIFDCDGTLVKSEEVNNKIIAHTLNKIGLEQYDFEYCINNFTGLSLPDILKKVNQNLGEERELEEEEMLYYINNLALDYLKEIEAVENTYKTLIEIDRGKCVASNGERNAVLKNLYNTGLMDFFRPIDVYTREQVNKPKPAPDLFLYAASNHQAAPQNTLVIEDSATGVFAAKEANMKVCGFIGSSHDENIAKDNLTAAGADYIVKDFYEILEYID